MRTSRTHEILRNCSTEPSQEPSGPCADRGLPLNTLDPGDAGRPGAAGIPHSSKEREIPAAAPSFWAGKQAEMIDDETFEPHAWETDWAEDRDAEVSEELDTAPNAVTNVSTTHIRGDSEFDVAKGSVSEAEIVGVTATRVPGLRSEQREHIIRMLDAGERLITITGLGGIGKSTLAQDVVDALHTTDPQLSFSTHAIAAAEGSNIRARLVDELSVVADQLTPNNRAEAAAESHLAVIDGGEHLVDNADELEKILESNPGLRLLVTSRLPLGIPSESTVALRGLDTSADGDGMRLLLGLAKEASVRIPTASLLRVRDIVSRLGGYPLAIRLCVAQLQSLSVNAVHQAMLASRTAGATVNDDTEPDAALHQVISWSLDRQSTDAVKLLKQLSVSGGWSTLDSIEGVAAVAERRIGHTHRRIAGRTLWLSQLIDAGLVDVEDAPPLGEDVQLYRVHDSVGDVVRGYRVEDETPEEVLIAAHQEWYLHSVADLAADASTRRELAAFERLQAELSQYVIALDAMIAVDPMEALIIVTQLGEFWTTRGRIRSGARLLHRALRQVGEDPEGFGSGPIAAVLGQSWLAHMRLREGAPLDLTAYRSWLSSHLRRMLTEAAEPTGEHFALAVHFIFLSMATRTYPAALQTGARFRDLAIDAGDDYHAGLFSFYLARVSEQADDREEAIRHIGQAIAHVRRTHNESFLARCMSQEILLRQSQLTPAELVDELTPIPAIHLRNRSFKDAALITIALVIAHFRAGENAIALDLLRRNLALSRRIHYFDGQLYSVILIAFADLSPESTPENVTRCARLYGAFRPHIKRFDAITAPEYQQMLHSGIEGLRLFLGQSALDLITSQSPTSWPQVMDEADAFAADIQAAAKADEPAERADPATRADAALAQLNERERELLALVLTGITDKQIAERLELKPNTVRSYNSRIFRKFGIASRTELLALFRDRGV